MKRLLALGFLIGLIAPAWAGQFFVGSPPATPGGSTLQLQFNNAGAFGGLSGSSWDDTNRSLTLTGATVTTSNPVLNLSQTWNAGGVTFTGLKFNITDSASATASLLMDLQVGGVSQFSVSKAGVITSTNGTLINNMVDTWNNAGTQFNAFKMNVTNTASAANSALLNLQIAGAPVFRALVTGPQWQQFNTYTSDTNFEAGGAVWASNVYKIGTSKGSGGGTARDTYIITPNRQWTFSDASANFQAAGGMSASTGGTIGWVSRGGMAASADGNFEMFNNAATSFTCLDLGLNTTSFPALCRSAAIMQVRLGDNSGDADLTARTLKTAGFSVATLPTAGTAGRQAYVTDQLTSCAAIGIAPTGGGSVVCPVFDNGVSWVSG